MDCKWPTRIYSHLYLGNVVAYPGYGRMEYGACIDFEDTDHISLQKVCRIMHEEERAGKICYYRFFPEGEVVVKSVDEIRVLEGNVCGEVKFLVCQHIAKRDKCLECIQNYTQFSNG